MHHPRLAGNYHNMGIKFGTTLREHGFGLQELQDAMFAFAKESEVEVKRVFPEIPRNSRVCRRFRHTI